MTAEPRIGDRERDEASVRLGEHYAAGRLDDEEYAERLDAVFTARTGSDLRQLFEDLPQAPAAPPSGPPLRRPAPGAVRARRRPPLLAIAVGVALLAIATGVEWWIVLIAVVVLAKLSGAWVGGPCGTGRAHAGRHGVSP